MSRQRRLALSLSATLLPSIALSASPEAANPATTLWYDKPASQWIEALPIGNGRLGAMIFGQPEDERVAINDITVWSGGPQLDANRTDGYQHLDKIRQTLREGRYKEAEQLCNLHLTCRVDYDLNKYQELGDLHFKFRLPAGNPVAYRRWLDLEQALAGIEFQVGSTQYRREFFSSAPDKVLVQRVTASTSRSVSFELQLSRKEKSQTRFLAPDTLVMTGNTGGRLDYQVNTRVHAKGGTVRSDGDKLIVDGADEVLLLTAAHTSYVTSRGSAGS